MLKAIALDDEPIALDVLKSLTEKVTFVEMAGYFTHAAEARAFLDKHPVDVLFLDIQMPDLSGIAFLKKLPNPPMVIFTTAYSEHAVEGFELDAIDYLLKPFSLTRFLKACNKAYAHHALLHQNKSPLSAVYIKSGYEQIRIEWQAILWVESAGNYVVFVLKNRKVASRLTMGEAEALLPASDFVRVHRSYIVAKKHVQKMDKKNVWVGETELPIGPAYLPNLEGMR